MKSIYWVIIAILIIIGVGVYVYYQGDKGESPESVTTEENVENESEEETFAGSMADLVARGGNYECSFEHDASGTISSGTTYVSGTKIRGDFEATFQGNRITSHMIQKDGYIYTWSSAMPNGGIKMKVPATTSGAIGAGVEGQYSDWSQNYSYDCDPWSPDESRFAVPTNITFTTVGQ